MVVALVSVVFVVVGSPGVFTPEEVFEAVT